MSVVFIPFAVLDSVIFMHDTYLREVTTSNPSSKGSKTSIISTELKEFNW